MKFEGIYTPVVTPYRDDFTIDYERLAEIIEFLHRCRRARPDLRRHHR